MAQKHASEIIRFDDDEDSKPTQASPFSRRRVKARMSTQPVFSNIWRIYVSTADVVDGNLPSSGNRFDGGATESSRAIFALANDRSVPSASYSGA